MQYFVGQHDIRIVWETCLHVHVCSEDACVLLILCVFAKKIFHTFLENCIWPSFESSIEKL